MKKIICEVCGYSDITKNDNIYVCQKCDAKYSLDEVQKLMINVDDTTNTSNKKVVQNNTQPNEEIEQIETGKTIVKSFSPTHTVYYHPKETNINQNNDTYKSKDSIGQTVQNYNELQSSNTELVKKESAIRKRDIIFVTVILLILCTVLVLISIKIGSNNTDDFINDIQPSMQQVESIEENDLDDEWDSTEDLEIDSSSNNDSDIPFSLSNLGAVKNSDGTISFNGYITEARVSSSATIYITALNGNRVSTGADYVMFSLYQNPYTGEIGNLISDLASGNYAATRILFEFIFDSSGNLIELRQVR